MLARANAHSRASATLHLDLYRGLAADTLKTEKTFKLYITFTKHAYACLYSTEIYYSFCKEYLFILGQRYNTTVTVTI